MSKKTLEIAFILAIIIVVIAGISNYVYFHKGPISQPLRAALLTPTIIPNPTDVIVSFDPIVSTVNPGDTFEVNLSARPQVVNGDTSTPYNIQGADLKVQFDPQVLEVVRVQAGGETDDNGAALESGNILSLTNGISDYGNLLANPPVNGTLLNENVKNGSLFFNVESRTDAGQNISYTNGILLGRITFRLLNTAGNANTLITTVQGGSVSRVSGTTLESYLTTIAQAEINPPVNTPTSAQQDMNPPVIALTYPANNQSLSRKADLNITATASDESGIIKVDFYINNKLECSDTASAYGCLWSVPAKPRASYTIRAVAFDRYNNQASQTITVTSQ